MAVAAGPFIGYGADFQDGVTSTTATVGHCVDIDPPEPDIGEVDASYVQMANAWKLKIPKLIDPKEAKFTIIWSEVVYAHIFALLRTPNYFFAVVFPDTGGVAGSKLTFQGFYKSITAPMKLEDEIVSVVTITVSGQVTLTAGS